MARTKAQLSREVLQRLVYAAGDEPSAEDAAYVEGVYDSKLYEWREDGLIYWPNTTRNAEEIPDRVFGALADLLENECRHTYKRDNPPVQRMAQEQALLYRLRKHMGKGPSGESTTFSSY